MTNPIMHRLASRPLFGGAIALPLPVDYLDASDLRQVPDNQEVFLSPTSETSVIVEILSMVEEGGAGTDLWEAAKFHFNSLAHDNSAISSSILSPPPPHPIPSTPSDSIMTPSPITLRGTQTIHKFSYDPTGAPRPGREGDEPDTVWIAVALWRCWLEPTGLGGAGRKKADVVLSVNVNLSAEGGDAERGRVEGWFEGVIRGFKVIDWGLFGDE